MNKRNVATVLWFLMGWSLGSVLAILLDLPTLVGGVPLAIASAAFIRAVGQRLWPTEAASARTTSAIVAHGPLATE